MSGLKDNLYYEIDWRTSEIATVRKLMRYEQLNDVQKAIVTKYASVYLYSLWEGFVVKCMNYYIQEVNNLKIKIEDISLKILTHTIDSEFNLGDERKDFDKKCSFINDLHTHFGNEHITVTKKIPTESNVNFKELNRIFKCYGFNKFLDSKYHGGLNMLLIVRNNVAHGEDSITVTEEMVDKLSFLVQDLMSEVADIINSEFENENYIERGV